MTEEQYTVFELRLTGKSHKEISTALGISEGASRKALHDGIKSLIRKPVKEDGYMANSHCPPMVLVDRCLASCKVEKMEPYGGGGRAGEWNRYIPRLNDKVDAICRNLAVLRSFHRTESGERWPKDINDRLLTLTDAMNEIGLSESEQQECTRVQNALIELQSAQETIERHGFPEPSLLAEIHIDLVRARNELDPNQPHDRPR